MSQDFFSHRLFVNLSFLACFFFLSLSSYAEETILFPIQKGDRLILKVFSGRIRLSSTERSKPSFNQNELKFVTQWKKKTSFVSGIFSRWNFSVIRKGSIIDAFVMSSFPSKFWKKDLYKEQELLKKEEEEGFLDLNIQGPSLPVEIYVRNADINVSNWSHELKIVQLKGRIKTYKTRGGMIIFGQKGGLIVNDHKGPLEIESYELNLNVSKVVGSIDVESFAGRAFFSDIVGKVRLFSYKGGVEVSTHQGSFEFENYNSRLKIRNMQGTLRGISLSGHLDVSLRGKTSVSVQTKEGNIYLRALNSGAWARLSTSEGSINAPSYFKRNRFDGQKIRYGLLRGKHSGKIILKSEKGSLRIR